MAEARFTFRTPLVALGRFRCPPEDPRWREENDIGDGFHVVFPHRAVRIAQARRGWELMDPQRVVFYDAHTPYRRGLVSPDGDRTTFLVVAPSIVRELVGEPGASRPSFPWTTGPLRAEVLFMLMALVRWVGGTGAPEPEVDPSAVEEELLWLLGEVRGDAAAAGLGGLGGGGRPRGSAARRPTTREAHRDLVEDARAVLALRFAERRPVAAVARDVGASPFHLARTFRAVTGSSLHAYRDQLRVRRALERVADGERDLAALAREVGFASHAHLVERFRHTFGVPPSAVRGSLPGIGPPV